MHVDEPAEAPLPWEVDNVILLPLSLLYSALSHLSSLLGWYNTRPLRGGRKDTHVEGGRLKW